MDHIVNLEFIGWAKSNTNCNVWGWEYQPFTQRWPGGGGTFNMFNKILKTTRIRFRGSHPFSKYRMLIVQPKTYRREQQE